MVLALCLGVALLVFGSFADRLLPTSAKLPLDLKHSTMTLQDPHAQAKIPGDPSGKARDVPMTLQEHTDVVDPANDDFATLRIGQSLVRGGDQPEAQRLASAQVWSYRINRLTGEAEGPATLADMPVVPGGEVPVNGYWFKFPANTPKQELPYFDTTLRQSRPAQFAEELNLNGRKVYRFHQDIAPTNLAKLFASQQNTTKLPEGEGPDAKMVPGYLFHGVVRDIYVDQVTGLVVKLDEKVDDYYGTEDGQKRDQQLLFSAATSEDDMHEFLLQAGKVDDGSLTPMVRWTALGLGGLLALAGLIGLFARSGKRRGPRGETAGASRSFDTVSSPSNFDIDAGQAPR